MIFNYNVTFFKTYLLTLIYIQTTWFFWVVIVLFSEIPTKILYTGFNFLRLQFENRRRWQNILLLPIIIVLLQNGAQPNVDIQSSDHVLRGTASGCGRQRRRIQIVAAGQADIRKKHIARGEDIAQVSEIPSFPPANRSVARSVIFPTRLGPVHVFIFYINLWVRSARGVWGDVASLSWL